MVRFCAATSRSTAERLNDRYVDPRLSYQGTAVGRQQAQARARSTRSACYVVRPGRSHSTAAIAIPYWHGQEASLEEPLASQAHP